MSGIYETDERLRSLALSHSYHQSPLALIVRSGQAHHFPDHGEIATMPDLRLAVRDGPVLVPMVHRLFPKANVTVLRGRMSWPPSPEARSTAWSGRCNRRAPGRSRIPASPPSRRPK